MLPSGDVWRTIHRPSGDEVGCSTYAPRGVSWRTRPSGELDGPWTGSGPTVPAATSRRRRAQARATPPATATSRVRLGRSGDDAVVTPGRGERRVPTRSHRRRRTSRL